MLKIDQEIELQLYHAVQFFAQGKTDQAITLFQTIIQNRRYVSSSFYGLGSIADQKGYYERRVALWYQQEIKANRLNVNAYDGLALCYSVNHKFQEAESYYQKLLAKYPGDNNLQLGLAHVFHNKGRVRQAIAEYQKVSGSFGKHYLTMLALEQGDIQSARIHHNFLKIEKNQSLSRSLMTTVMGSEEEREIALQKFTYDQPKYVRAYLVLGAELQRKGKSQKAIAAYEQAIKRDSKYSAAIRKLAQLHGKLQHRKQALGTSQKLDIGGQDILNKLQYATDLLANGQLNEGQKALQNAIKDMEYEYISLEKSNFNFFSKFIKDSLVAVRKEKIAPNNLEWKCEIAALTQFNNSLQSQWEEHLNITLSKLRLNNPKLNIVIALLTKNSFRLDENSLFKQIFELYSKEEGYFQAVGVACSQYANKRLQEGISHLQIEEDLRKQLQYQWNKSVKSEMSEQITNLNDPDYKKVDYQIFHTENRYDLFKSNQFYSSYNHLVLALKKLSKKAKMIVSDLQDFLKGLKTSADGFEQSIKCKVTPFNECSAINSIIFDILPEAAKSRQKLLQVAQPGLSLPVILQNVMEIWKDEVTKILKEKTIKKEATHCYVDDWIQIECHFASQTRMMMAVKQLESQCKERQYEIFGFDGKLLDRKEEAVIFKIRVKGVGCKVRLAVHRQSKLRQFQQELSNMVNNPMGPLFSSLLSLTTKNEVSFLNHCRELKQKCTDSTLSIELKQIVNQLEDPQLLDIQSDDLRESSTTIRRTHIKTEASQEGRGFESLNKRVKTLESEKYEDQIDEEPPVCNWEKNRRFSLHDEEGYSEDMRKTTKFQQFKLRDQRPETLRSSEIIFNKEYSLTGQNQTSEKNFILDIISPQKVDEIERERQQLLEEKFAREDSWQKEKELFNKEIIAKQELIDQLSNELNEKQEQFAQKENQYKSQVAETIEELEELKQELQKYSEEIEVNRTEISILKQQHTKMKALLIKNTQNECMKQEVWFEKVKVLNHQLQEANHTIKEQRSKFSSEKRDQEAKITCYEQKLHLMKDQTQKLQKNVHYAQQRATQAEKKQKILVQDNEKLQKELHTLKKQVKIKEHLISQGLSRQLYQFEDIKRLNEQIKTVNQLAIEDKQQYNLEKIANQNKIAALIEKISSLNEKNERLQLQLQMIKEQLKIERNQMIEVKSSAKWIEEDMKRKEEAWEESQKLQNQKIVNLKQSEIQWRQRQQEWKQKQRQWKQIQDSRIQKENQWKSIIQDKDQKQRQLQQKIEELQKQKQEIYVPKVIKVSKFMKEELDLTSDVRTSPMPSPKSKLDISLFSQKSPPSKRKVSEIGVQSMSDIQAGQHQPVPRYRCLCRGRIKQVGQMHRNVQNYKLIFAILTIFALSVSFSVRLLR